jgi:hypothetical protein
MAENDRKNGLTRRHKRAIAAILASQTLAEAAQTSKISERSLYRYLERDDFRRALNQAESEAIAEAGRRLITGQTEALNALEKLITGAKKEADKRLAAVAWLRLVLHWRELSDIEQRLSRLEDYIYDNKK